MKAASSAAERIRHSTSSPVLIIAAIALAGLVFIGMPLGLMSTPSTTTAAWVLWAIVAIVGFSKVAHDLTERRRVEDALRQAQARLHAALEAGHMGTWVLDGYANRISWDDACAALFGRTIEEVQGCDLGTFMGYLHPADRARTEAAIVEALAGDLRYHVEYRTIRPDGALQWIAARGSVNRDADGDLSRLTGACVDVTERKQQEETIRELNADLERRVLERTAELVAANKELEAFSYSVSHDLRSPLRAVDGFSQALLHDYGAQLPQEGHRYLETICSAARKMGQLIDDLLAFSRLSRQALSTGIVDHGQLVQSVLEELRAEREGRVVDVCVGDLAACEGDRALLRQAWFNLVSNALKYTRKRARARVEIGCLQQGGETVYFVRDNGSGFDMRYANKLFGVFERLHLPEDFEGTGVGLAIVQRIVHRHGGRIWAEAEVERGASFYFTLAGRTDA